MPYITEEAREELDNQIESLARSLNNEGEINYAVSRILSIACGITEPRYGKINKAIGVLECIKLEFYRRVAEPYEDIKIKENGDVHEYRAVKEAVE